MNRFDIDYHSPEFGLTCPRVAQYMDSNVIDNLEGADEIVAPYDEITIEFKYPLSKTVRFGFERKGGFTRKQFFACIWAAYNRIYNEEDAAVGHPGNIPGMLNRAESKGPYGIWGHDVGDLYIEGVEETSTAYYTLLIGS